MFDDAPIAMRRIREPELKQQRQLKRKKVEAEPPAEVEGSNFRMWTPTSGTNSYSASASSGFPPTANGMNLQNRAPSTPTENDSAQRDRLNQIFNTALVSTRSEGQPESAGEIRGLMETPAFAAILQSIQVLASEHSISEVEAAREIIRTFRRMDQLWTEYLVAEGVERLKLSN